MDLGIELVRVECCWNWLKIMSLVSFGISGV
jgi:hypothetical protein